MNLDSVRTFVTVADTGQFQAAAADLAVTQQAVSKRVSALERTLGVRLFTRDGRGADLTIDGQAFLPHARALLRAQERALASVRPGHRPLRLDVIGRRLAPADLLRDFHRAHESVELDVVTLFDADAAVAAVRSGTVDASFRALPPSHARLPEGVVSARVLDEPLQLLAGPGHVFARARSVTPVQLAGHRLWMPGLVSGTEWAAYYDALAAAFGLTIEVTGPDFGTEPLLDMVADSPSLATLVGGRTRLVWPADAGLRRVDLRDPTPVYPHCLLWRLDNPHPDLVALRDHLGSARPSPGAAGTWTPSWARGALSTAGPDGRQSRP